METTTVNDVWSSVKSIGPFILWKNNGQGSLLKFTFTKANANPEENDQYWFSRKACEMALEDQILVMIKRKLGRETLLTQAQQKAIIKRIQKRNYE